jgi:hypothetical protein
MGERRRLRSAARAGLCLSVVVALGLVACGGDSGPTTTRFIPPTSEDIFELTSTTTTTRAPQQLDPVPFDDLGVTVGIPHDWGFETEAVRMGEAAALFVAGNGAGGLLVVGRVVEVDPAVDVAAAPTELAEAAARALTVLFDQRAGDPRVVNTSDVAVAGTTGGRVTLEVDLADGTRAYVSVVVVPVGEAPVFAAFLHEDDFPENRIVQGDEALASITVH